MCRIIISACILLLHLVQAAITKSLSPPEKVSMQQKLFPKTYPAVWTITDYLKYVTGFTNWLDFEPNPEKTVSDSPSLSLATLNTYFENFFNGQRYRKSLDNLKQLSPDIIALQECTVEFLREFLAKDVWIQQNYIVSDVSGVTFTGYGVTLLVKKSRPDISLHSMVKIPFSNSKQARALVAALVSLGQYSVAIGTAHFESKNAILERAGQFEVATEYLRKTDAQVLFLCGDFNIEEDKAESETIKNFGWSDACPKEDPRFQYTVGKWGINKRKSARLDRIHHQSRQLQVKVKDFKYFGNDTIEIAVPPYGSDYIYPSDHLGVYAEFELE